MRIIRILNGSEIMDKKVNITSIHTRIRMLRDGKKVSCSKCKKGTMKPIGDCGTTNTFICDNCKNQIIIN